MKNHRTIHIWPVYVAVFAALVSGCAGGNAGKERPFPYVTVPGVITDGAEAAEFLGEHFWDDFMDTTEVFLCDSSHVNGVTDRDFEQAFADYAGILGMLPLEDAEQAVEDLYIRSEAFERHDSSTNVFEETAALAEKYLYDPNSPFRNENMYFRFVDRLAGYTGFTDVQRDAYRRTADMCSLNMIGYPATDFEFSDRSGKVYSLYGIKADYTLLFFSNPGCEACMRIINILDNDMSVRALISEGRLAVVNVYIDEDVASWYSYMKVYPESWYNGYDHNLSIRTGTLYDVRAIPSLYLLDRDKKVLLKDAPEKIVFAAIDSL